VFQRDQVIDWNQVRPEILDVAPGRQVEQQGEGIGGVDASPAPQVEAPLQKLLCLGVFVAGHLAHQKAAEGENTSTPLSPCHTHTSTARHLLHKLWELVAFLKGVLREEKTVEGDDKLNRQRSQAVQPRKPGGSSRTNTSRTPARNQPFAGEFEVIRPYR